MGTKPRRPVIKQLISEVESWKHYADISARQSSADLEQIGKFYTKIAQEFDSKRENIRLLKEQNRGLYKLYEQQRIENARLRDELKKTV